MLQFVVVCEKERDVCAALTVHSCESKLHCVAALLHCVAASERRCQKHPGFLIFAETISFPEENLIFAGLFLQTSPVIGGIFANRYLQRTRTNSSVLDAHSAIEISCTDLWCITSDMHYDMHRHFRYNF